MMEFDNEWKSIEVADKSDRTVLVPILANNDYTVRIVRRKKSEKARQYTYYVEYKKEL